MGDLTKVYNLNNPSEYCLERNDPLPAPVSMKIEQYAIKKTFSFEFPNICIRGRGRPSKPKKNRPPSEYNKYVQDAMASGKYKEHDCNTRLKLIANEWSNLE
jgi:hypothetical protein